MSKFFYIPAFLCLISFKTVAQKSDALIVGQWCVSRFVYLSDDHTSEDSLELIRQIKSAVFQFKKDGTYTTFKKNLNSKKEIDSGKYEVSPDSKYLYQGDKEAEIITLSIKELVIKIEDELKIYFKRISTVE